MDIENNLRRYPIYHIPMGRTLKELSTCFLTYQTLSSSFQGLNLLHIHYFLFSSFLRFVLILWYVKTYLIYLLISDLDLEDEMWSIKRKQKKGKGISLAPFGAVTYKMQGHVWVSSKSSRDQDKLNSLQSVADSWLKQLRVQHHDFNFFTRNRHA